MGISMLKMDRAKAKWRVKLQRAFAGKGNQFTALVENTTVVLTSITTAEDRGSKTGKYVLFILPLITVLREGKPLSSHQSTRHSRASHRHGSRHLRWRRVSRPAGDVHPYRSHRRSRLWSHLRLPHLCVRQQDECVPPPLSLFTTNGADDPLPAALTVFMVVMTNFLILIGAGLFSKAIWAFQENAFNNL